MFEHSIDQILYKDEYTKKIYLFAKNELPKRPKFPSCFIINTDPREEAGEHWLAFNYSSNGFCYFFDSYGKSPSYYDLEDYIENTSNNWTYNKRRLQGNSIFCGYYAILFLLYKTREKTIDFFKEFYLSYSKNDKKIFNLIKEFS
jgi:hypothetical protein